MKTRFSFVEQKKFVDECRMRSGVFADLLTEHSKTYDDLVYADEATACVVADLPEFLPVDKRPRIANGIPCVSFFSGAGGLDVGFECAGFHTLADVEIVPMFCETLRKNGHRVIVGPPNFTGDMSKPKNVIAELESIGVPQNFPGVFHGGPPCQSFSIAANQRFNKNGENFKRTGFNHVKLGNLLFCYIDVILHFRPEVFLIENVEGLLTIDGGEQSAHACDLLRSAGYDVTPPRIVNAADYGVPQKRLRTIIVGSRIGHFSYPRVQEQIPVGSVFKKTVAGLPNHQTRVHSAESIARYMILEYGKRDQLGRVDRLDPFKPSKTIIAGGTGGGGRSHLHPFIPRTMSVRECARIQTFPDTYEFTGPVARQFTQCGNAVPPVLAYEMACAIYRSIYEKTGARHTTRQIPIDFHEALPTQMLLAVERKKAKLTSRQKAQGMAGQSYAARRKARKR